MSAPDDLPPSCICRRVIFSGRVQGVGFRYTTRKTAARFAVTGFVKNLRDGTVELVAQGNPEIVSQFIAEIEREFAGYVTDRKTTDLTVHDDLAGTGFSIRY